MLQQDQQEAQIRVVADSIRKAYVDPDATEEIDRAISAAGDEAVSDDDDEC